MSEYYILNFYYEKKTLSVKLIISIPQFFEEFHNQICLKICLVLSAEAKNTDKIIKQKLRNTLFKVILNRLLV